MTTSGRWLKTKRPTLADPEKTRTSIVATCTEFRYPLDRSVRPVVKHCGREVSFRREFQSGVSCPLFPSPESPTTGGRMRPATSPRLWLVGLLFAIAPAVVNAQSFAYVANQGDDTISAYAVNA